MQVRNSARHAPKLGLTQADKQGNQVISQALAAGPLAQGSTVPAVKWVNRMLGLAGYGTTKEGGAFTAKTTTALQQFQAAEGLPVTGQLDQASFKRLSGVELRVRNHRDEFIGVGQKSSQVLGMERRLASLGYNTGPADGVFDTQDASALAQFKRDQRLGGRSPEALTANADKALSAAAKGLQHSSYWKRVAPSKSHKRLDAFTAQQAASPTGIADGSRGKAVANVQARLRAAGFDPLRGDGTFDDRTRGAVEAFQRESGLPATGIVDAQTWSKLSRSFAYTKSSTGPAQSLGEKDGAVSGTQKLLRQLGYKGVRQNGIFDKSTQNAVKTFEKRHHLRATGQVDAADLASMKKAVAAQGVKQVVPGQVGRWIAEAQTILKNAGLPLGKMNAQDINIIIQHESSGNPSAENKWDINWQQGHPSIGLMQVIGPTFNQYKLGGHGNIWNPIDNIIAGVRYAVSRYGSISNVPGVVDVHNGGSYVGY